MGIFREDIHLHFHINIPPSSGSGELNTQIKKIMSQLDDLKAQSAELKSQVATLQASVDTEQAQIAALLETNAGVVQSLNAQIATLEGQLANAVDPAALQVVIDEMKETSAIIVTTKADIESTIPDEPSAP